jgi:adenylosuccinate synthase
VEVLVVGCQSGDEGKGKFADVFCEHADLVIRYQGGPHTGHTVVVDGTPIRFVQLPVGTDRGVRGVIGNGCVVDPAALLAEMAERGVEDPRQLLISRTAHVVLPYHRLQDEGMERWRGDAVAISGATGFADGSGQIGSTRKGVGPCREDKMARIGLRLVDLTDPDLTRARLARLVPLKRSLLVDTLGLPAETVDDALDIATLARDFHEYGRQLEPFLGDVSAELRAARASGANLVHEGAQSVALDIEHGTYPYCSSGYSAAGGVTVGTGSPPNLRLTVVGVAKSYMVQAGGGPLPAEITGPLADRLVRRGVEVGTVTGRRRRVGWFDVPFVRNAVLLDGVSHLCLTNIDVLAGLDEVAVATHYLLDGRRIEQYPVALAEASRVEPVLQTLPGWPEFDREQVALDGYRALPPAARAFAEFVSARVGAPLAALGIGRERRHTVWLDHGSALRDQLRERHERSSAPTGGQRASHAV